jgi:hypothetical protein
MLMRRSCFYLPQMSYFAPDGTYNFWENECLLNTSLAVNMFYNAYRSDLKATIRANLSTKNPSWSATTLQTQTDLAFDNMVIDFRTIPGVSGVIDWLVQFASKHLPYQNLVHRNWNGYGSSYDSFGVFQTVWWTPDMDPNVREHAENPPGDLGCR